jgi:stage III sporulation protein AH
MNKKQAGIIVTLLALIVCAGILAARVNGPLEVSNLDSGSGVFNLNTNEEKSSSNSDFFVSAKLERDQNDAKVLASFQTMIQDKNVSKASKEKAEEDYLAKTTDIDHEGKIEINVKSLGFSDAICLIENNKAKVIIKGQEVTEKQRKQIQDIVKNVAGSKVEVEVQVQQ